MQASKKKQRGVIRFLAEEGVGGHEMYRRMKAVYGSKMLFFLLSSILNLSYVYGGTPCPPREEIYPCICIDKSIGRSKFETTVICQSLTHGDAFRYIEPGLASTEIDSFLLYDSFWSTHPRLLQSNARIPVNRVSTFKITDIKVVDTHLSTLACPQSDNCVTSYTKRFTAINSSVSDSANCPTHFSMKSWIGCPGNIEEILISGGYTTNITLRPDFFPETYSKLKALRMPYNNIIKVERRTFVHSKFPVLETLDLSHNSLKEIKILFASALRLKHLDLSFNSVRSIVDLQYLPQLKFLNLSNNHIIILLQNEWVNMPSNLRTVDLSSNDLTCDCSLKWLNSTIHINTNLIGECKRPSQVADKGLRRAWRLLNERCDDEGNILASRYRPTVATTTAPSK